MSFLKIKWQHQRFRLSEKYKNQYMFVIEIDSYAYIVPFVENDDEIFLKTIYPGREAAKEYLNKE
jgi:hypothetical protein